MSRARTIIPIALFAFQLGAIIYARFVPTRYFCWAPYDIQTDYTATAMVNGRKLTNAEFRQRYRRPPRGFDNRSPQHVFDMLEQVEQKRCRLGEQATVVVKYRVNGKEPREWRWPHPTGPSWNPLKFHGTELPTELLILVKLLALVVLLVNHVRILPDPWLPFVPGIDLLPPVLFQRTLQVVFVTCALALLFNRRVRLASLLLGSTMLVAVVSSKAYYGNNKTFCGLMFLLTGLSTPGRKPWPLQWQLGITYFGAGLNKLLDADWHSGVFFQNWAVERLRQPWYMALDAILPPMMLARLMCWTTIVTELGIVPALFIPRLRYWAVWANILFQSGLLLFTGTTFTLFFYSMTAASLAFVTWPAGPLSVRYQADCEWLERLRTLAQFCDADRLLSWAPCARGAKYWLHLPIENRIHTNFRALRMIVLLNPLTYLTIAATIALAADVPSATALRIIVTICLFFLMPPLATILDRIFSGQPAVRSTATGVGRITGI